MYWLGLGSETTDLGEPQGSAYWPMPGAFVGAVVGSLFNLTKHTVCLESRNKSIPAHFFLLKNASDQKKLLE